MENTIFCAVSTPDGLSIFCIIISKTFLIYGYLNYPIIDQGSHDTEISKLIRNTNKLTES